MRWLEAAVRPPEIARLLAAHGLVRALSEQYFALRNKLGLAIDS
jgi:hypothetical protein